MREDIEQRIMAEIAQKIRIRRQELSLRQRDIAQKLNVHPVRISYWESGKVAIPVIFLMMLCVFLKVPISYFYPAGLLWEMEQDMLDRARLKARLYEEARRFYISMYHK